MEPEITAVGSVLYHKTGQKQTSPYLDSFYLVDDSKHHKNANNLWTLT